MFLGQTIDTLRWLTPAFVAAFLIGLFCSSIPARAQSLPYDITQQCFALADERNLGGGITDGVDALVRFDRTTNQSTVIDLTGTKNIEAIAMQPGSQLFAADGGQLGSLDLVTGLFTAKPNPVGSGNGPLGTINFDNIDGIFYDIRSATLWGVQRMVANPDLLLQIDPTTGMRVANAFGAGIDYVEIQPTIFHGSSLGEIDDIAVNPLNGVMVGSANLGGSSAVLVTINPATGATALIGEFRYPAFYPANPALAGKAINDIEGLSFFNDGQLYGSTGNQGPDDDDKNQLFAIDQGSAIATALGALHPAHADYEGVACLTAPTFLYLEQPTNREGITSPPGLFVVAGAPITWSYTLTNSGVYSLTDLNFSADQLGPLAAIELSDCPNSSTTLNPGDGITCTVTRTALAGQFRSTLGVTATSVDGVVAPRQTVSATNVSYYFGAQSAIAIDASIPGEPANNPPGPFILASTPLTWEYAITNTGNITLTQLTVRDGQSLITCPKELLSPGDALACIGVRQTAGEGQVENIATVVATPTVGSPITGSDLTHYIGYLPATLGNLVFSDINPNGTTPAEIATGNGVYDPGEQGVDGVIVQLHLADGSFVTETVTVNGGEYLFTGLLPGRYSLTFINPLAKGDWATADVGSNDQLDSDAKAPASDPRGSAMRTDPILLQSGQIDLSWDAALVTLPDAAPKQQIYLPLVSR